MKANRILCVLIVLACVLATVAALRPGWLDCRWSRNEHRPWMRVILAPDKLSAARTQRLVMKGRVIQHLRDGELTLFQAAAVFGQLNSRPPVLESEGVPGLSGTDEGEWLCRQVIRWAEAEWEDEFRPEELKARVDRLEQELQEHIAAHGGVQLPTHVL